MNALASILSFLFPQVCIGCKNPGTALCSRCITTIPNAKSTGKPHTIAAFEYNHPIIKEIIYSLKYKHRTEAAKILIQHANEALLDYLTEQMIMSSSTNIVFVPIPTSKTNTKIRGYNQALLIAQRLHSYFPNAVIKKNGLIRTRNTKPQTYIKKRDARIKNMGNAFLTHLIQKPNTVIIVVDDIITTGATIEAGMAAFKQKNWSQVYGFALAHGSLR